MKHVLLTGVAGFIGAHTLEHFLEHTDWFIAGVDSLEHRGDMRRIEQVLRKNDTWRHRFKFYKYDLAEWEARQLHYMLGPAPDYIINMAAESHVDRSITDPVPFVKNNVNLVLTMLEYARLVRPKVFIQISTDEVYGPMLNGHPFKEWERELPSNPYSASKAAQEMIAISYWRTYGVRLVITNTMNNYGQLQDVEKFVPMLIRDISAGRKAQIHGTAQTIGTRFYLHARNHADALLFILKQLGNPVTYSEGNEFPDRYHVVGDVQLTNLEMAQKVADILGKPLDYELVDFHSTRPGHDLHYGLDGSRLYKLGWRPPVEFDDSLKATVKDYIMHQEWLEG